MSGLLDRIHANLVGLNMPRALETLADVVQRLERGEIGELSARGIRICMHGKSSGGTTCSSSGGGVP